MKTSSTSPFDSAGRSDPPMGTLEYEYPMITDSEAIAKVLLSIDIHTYTDKSVRPYRELYEPLSAYISERDMVRFIERMIKGKSND